MSDAPVDLPALDSPLGSLDFRLRRRADDGFEVAGRRGEAAGTGQGIDVIRLGGTPVIRGLRVRRYDGEGIGAAETVETPLGVERRLDGGLVERVVVSRDAPVAWLEWAPAAPVERGAPADPSSDSALEITWRIDGGPWARERVGRGLRLVRDDGVRLVCVFSAEPEAFETGDGAGAAGEIEVRARVPLPDDGLRLAVVGIGGEDDAARLLRIAGRPRVAVRGREGAANRVLADGLRVASPDPALDAAVARAVIRFDATRLDPAAGSAEVEAATSEALARLAAGDFESVHAFLRALADTVDDDGRLPPDHRGDRPELLFLLLVVRALAWSGDLPSARTLWPAVERVAGGIDPAGPDDTTGSLRTAALDALDVAAEAIGAGDSRQGGSGSAIDATIASGSPVATVVLGHLGADPDAPRGRLVLRPRLPADWDRLEVRGLAVGSASLDVVYRREAGVHRFRLEQTRGPSPLQLVLEPELEGDGEVVARVDGEPAALDPVPANGRRRIPVQLVLSAPRTLEVEFGQDSM